MHPAECVNDIMRQIPAMDTVDGVTDVLPCSHYDTRHQEKGDCPSVVQLEHEATRAKASELKKGLQSARYVVHVASPVTKGFVTSDVSCSPHMLIISLSPHKCCYTC
jgi:hypothetical protein